MISATIPSPPVSSFSIGPVTIHFYALFILTGIAIAYWWSLQRWIARDGDRDDYFDIVFVTIIAGIIGARMYHVGVNIPDYFGPGKDPLSALRMWEGGLGIWGAVAGGGLAAFVMTRRKGVQFLALADSIAPTLFVAQAIGRLGNWANQELHGEPSTLPWALEITCETNGKTIVGCVPGTYQPTFLYEGLWNIAACVVVLLLAKRFAIAGGRIFLMYIIAYSAGRTLMETMRTEPSTMVFGLRIHMVIYIITGLVAIAVFAWLTIRARKKGEARSAYDTINGDPLPRPEGREGSETAAVPHDQGENLKNPAK